MTAVGEGEGQKPLRTLMHAQSNPFLSPLCCLEAQFVRSDMFNIVVTVGGLNTFIVLFLQININLLNFHSPYRARYITIN